MTNEINNLLDYLKDKNIYVEEHNYCYKRLSLEECGTISNYITDLQEENEHLDKVNCQLRKKINNDIYKQRIDKAIKYINEITYCEFDNSYMKYGDDLTPEYIIKVLRGKDND